MRQYNVFYLSVIMRQTIMKYYFFQYEKNNIEIIDCLDCLFGLLSTPHNPAILHFVDADSVWKGSLSPEMGQCFHSANLCKCHRPSGRKLLQIRSVGRRVGVRIIPLFTNFLIDASSPGGSTCSQMPTGAPFSEHPPPAGI